MATRLKKNILSNLAGGGWNTLLVILVTPVQVAALGIEAFGLLSLIAVLQIVAGAFDFGLATTVTREIAREDGDRNRGGGAAAFVNAAAAIYWFFAFVIAAALWFSAETIPAHWLKTGALPRSTIADSFCLIAVFLLLRWPIALYAGVLSGVQRMGLLNTLKSAAMTLRLAGGAFLLLIKPDLLSLLGWYVATAALELAAFVTYASRSYSGLRWLPRFDLAAIRRASNFSTAMYAIALLAMLLTQIDRLFIGGFLGLAELGYYSVAYTAALGMSLLQTSINNAALPAFANAHGAGEEETLTDRYERLSELMGFVMTPVACTLIFFGRDLFRVWVGAEVADAACVPLALLATGFLFNAMFSNCYIYGVAAGQPALFLRANVAGFLLYLPTLITGILIGGIAGAGAAWLVLNLFYIVCALPRAHVSLKLAPAGSWLRRNAGVFVVAGLIAFGGGTLAAHLIGGRAGPVAGLACACAAYLWMASRFGSSALARGLRAAWQRLPGGGA
jgi:O-antigen/teichoic acid export membrane protein